MKPSSRFLLFFAISFAFVAASLHATTFVVPTDRDMVHRADLIVAGAALTSYTQLTPEGGVETVTPLSVHEVIKGKIETDTIDVVEPGGTYRGLSMLIPGSPRFAEGEEVLLMLRATGKDRWSAAELVLGKFTFKTDAAGQRLLVRDEDEIVGWDPDLKPHREARRAAEPFLQFVREESKGIRSNASYFVTGTQPLRAASTSKTLQPSPNVAPYSATSYTMSINGSQGSRWTVFPNAVTWYSGTVTEPGAPGGGTTAINIGISAWNNDCGSNVNYVYAGTDNGTHTQGLHAPDGANTVLFEQDLSAWGVSPFSCSSNGYGGTLGIGGITSASGTNTLGTETFETTQEADVMMNQGIANCTLLFSNGDFNSAVTHELGHTLGFRHSDQNRASSGACSTDPSLECSSNAIMTANVTTGLNGVLQTWDVHAVDAVYPGNVCTPGSTPPPTCTPPAITSGPNSATITAGSSVQLSVTATGTTPLTYQWYTGGPGDTGNPIGTGNPITVSPAVTTSYWVRVSNSCGAVTSGSSTVNVTQPPPPPASRHTYGDFNGDGKSDPAVYRPSNYTWYISGMSSVVWAGDQPAPADYNGDGKTEVAVYRTSEGKWYILQNGATRIVQWGGDPSDRAVAADYDGDGKADFAVYRASEGKWYILLSSTGATRIVQWGATSASYGDIPVPADYDGDGKADIAIYRAAEGKWYILLSSNGGTRIVQWGAVGVAYGDKPVPSDYDGDGKADIAIYRASEGKWYILNSSDGSTRIVQWGNSTDQPQPGDFDGDGKADIAVFRPSSGQWLIIDSSTNTSVTVTLGQSGDIAVTYPLRH